MVGRPQRREDATAAGGSRALGSSAPQLHGALFAVVPLIRSLVWLAPREWGARLYFWARVAYVPLYAAGVPLIRSLVWNVATVGILLLVAALLSG